MIWLLDVNVLIALIDPAHLQHDAAHDWFAAEGRHAWATCPLTENGVLRILGHARYPNAPGPPSLVADLVAQLRTAPGHHFWPDDISLLDASLIDRTRLGAAAHLTDTYLLALAAAHDGRLATFDRRMSPAAVRHGADILHLIG